MVAVENEKKQQSARRPVKSGGKSVSTETVARTGAVLSPGRKKGLTGEPKKGEPAPKTVGPKAEKPAQPTEPAEEKEERLSPKDVDYQSPLVICLSIITRLAGNPVSAATLKAGLPQSNSIVTAASLVRAAEKIGFIAKTVHRQKVANISELVMPCILLLRGGNACVLQEIIDDKVRILVPGYGMRIIEQPLEALEKEYTGYAILCRKQVQLDKRIRDLKLIKTKRWFWGVIFSFWPIYQHVLLASLMINIIVIASPLFVMNVYDRVVPNNAFETLWALAVGIGIAYSFDFLLKNLRGYFVDVAGRNADVLIGSRLLQHLMAARLDHMPESAGAIANNVREFDSLREFFSSSSLVALLDLPFLVLFLFTVYYIGGIVIWPMLVAVPLVLCVGYVLQFPFQHVVASHYKDTTQKNALLFEIIQGLETIKTSMAEGRMQARWENIVGRSSMSNSRAKFLANMSVTFSVFVSQFVSVCVIITGVYLISEGEMTMGGLIACNILAGRAMAPLSAVAGLLARLQQSRMALNALNMLMELPSERPDDKETFHYGECSGAISLERVSFSYPGTDRAVLSDVNLMLQPGEKVGIIGRTGAGKTSLGKLCVGLYQPTQGAVKVGGIDLRQMDVANVRRSIGYIGQDPLLFYGSLRDNIAFGLPEADDLAIKRAAEIAGVDEFVKEHPAGYGMKVGERGSALSGGQRQAVSIARALLADPHVLIMDEPTSNMDNQSELNLRSRLAPYIKDKTVIFITHRYSLLDLVDRLLIMSRGRIVVDGPKDKVFAGLQSGKIKIPG